MTTNGTSQLVSTFIEKQLPSFIREDNPTFVNFLEAYYEYLEQANTTLQYGKTIERAKNLLLNSDIDTSIDAFSEKMYKEFLAFFPKDAALNKKVVLKRAKDFYRSRGSEKSFRFLFRALYGLDSDIYLPKNDVLIVSNGKWLIERSIKIKNVYVNGVLTNTTQGADYFINTKAKGETSTASAIVERITTAIVNSAYVFEMYVSNIEGVFIDGETISTVDGY